MKDSIYSAQPGTNGVEAERIGEAFVSWFRENARDLPWRRTRDPYAILVSEVMLQQIQVMRAVPFYLRFLERFPTVEALADAPISEAIRVWGDLGRYKRVVNLHSTVRIVVEEYGGEIPSDPEALVKLPGVGPYTAGAVACFAFERDAAFVDTNMRRVLHRLFFGPEVPGPGAGEKEILAVATALVPEGRGWMWNQALMELGALVCTARRPRCDSCPVSARCRARPGIADALSGTPRAAGKGTGHRYEDSNRFYRGRALAKLREAPEGGIGLRSLGEALREGFAEGDVPWILGVAKSLEKDGLAVILEERPGREAVAKERPAYGPEKDRDVPRETRVRLP